jgi:hypothetical protein
MLNSLIVFTRYFYCDRNEEYVDGRRREFHTILYAELRTYAFICTLENNIRMDIEEIE